MELHGTQGFELMSYLGEITRYEAFESISM